jgi:hypothetical protein
MSQKATTATVGRLEAGESQHGDLAGLAELAREAFEQKRTKDCLDLTRAMLLVDPGNADAQSMRLSIQSEMHRDLDNARAFIHVEIGISRKGTFAAGALLLSDFFHSRRLRGVRWLLVGSAFIVVGVVLARLPRFKTSNRAVESSLQARSSVDTPKPTLIEEVRPPLIEAAADLVPAPPAVPMPAVPIKPATPLQKPEPRAAAILPDLPVVTGTGILAVSSSSAVDIYQDGAYLGSVPVSLELSAGEHTLEYRHGSLRKFLTHVIKRNETAKAMVVFDVSVQVNSKPWSEVFLDGVEKKDLGQTPLSGVRVPIGGVLIFENPQFQAKRYRITGNETGIQVVFP